jgi:mannose/fructose-specific phosphotransferase system component IIA
MASGMKNSIDVLMGNSDCITAFDAYVEEEPVERALERFLAETKETGICRILLSDIYGGSVNQVFSRYCKEEKVMVITGANLALLMALVDCHDEDVTQEQIERIIMESREMIKIVTLDFEVQEEEFF